MSALTASAPKGSAALFEAQPELATQAGLVTWPNPWATRLLFTGGEHPRLLRLELRTGVYWRMLIDGVSALIDAAGNLVNPEQTAVDPALIAGIMVLSPELSDEACAAPRQRLLVVTNPDVVVAWSIGDDTSMARVTSDARRIEELLEWMRPCAAPDDSATWIPTTACGQYAGADTPVGGFERGLALAAPQYHPAPATLAHLADTLKADRREWNEVPLLVRGMQAQGVDAGVESSGDTSIGFDTSSPDAGARSSSEARMTDATRDVDAASSIDAASSTVEVEVEAGVVALDGAVTPSGAQVTDTDVGADDVDASVLTGVGPSAASTPDGGLP